MAPGMDVFATSPNHTDLSDWRHREVVGRDTAVREGVLVEQDAALSVKESLPGRVLSGVLLEVYVRLRLLAV